ncbi:MAG: M20/M25/M40 family metallo-hydrolase [Dissulfurispiraceae bacterium]
MEIADFINQERLVETFVELIKINSPSFRERELGDLLARKLAKLGCEIELQAYDRSFNLIARKTGQDGIPPLLLSGHMDTIEPTEGITFAIEDGLIKTTGNTVLGADDKSAIAQILEVLSVLEEREIPHGDLEIVFTSAEERGLVGAKHLDFGRLKSKYALVLDSGGSIGNIVVGAPSHYTYEMTVKGKSAHAGMEPERGISAIRVAANIIAAIPDGKIDAETTANVGVIQGGTATNVVPKETVIRGEIRSHNAETLEKTKKAILETAQRTAQVNHAHLLISEHDEYQAFHIDKDEPILRFLAGVFTRCGIEPAFAVVGGGSDASIFNQRGMTAINMSTGMQNVHSTEELIYIKDLFNGCVVLLTAISMFREFGKIPL